MTSLREDDQAILSQSWICESLSCTEIHCLVYIASEIHMKITMSSESSDLETRFESDDMEMNFIDGYELEDEWHSSPSHHDHHKPCVIQMMTVLLILTSH